MELAFDLNKRYLKELPDSDIAKVNFHLIKIKKHNKLSDEEQQDVLEILERAENEKNRSICFACEVLLKNKLKARKLFNSLDQ